MSDAKPLLLVHGAWHGAWCWAALQAGLDARGVPSQAVDLPGHGVSIAPLADLYTDIEHVTAVLDHLGDDVVLVGHSYGGAVITGAAARTSARLAHLVYLAAFALDDGESVMSLLGTLPPADTALVAALAPGDDGTTVLMDEPAARTAFYEHCPAAVATAAFPRLCRQPMITMGQPVQGAPRAGTPSTYVCCLQDRAVHPSHQAVMAARCTTAIELDTDHSPFLSMVSATADILEWISRR